MTTRRLLVVWILAVLAMGGFATLPLAVEPLIASQAAKQAALRGWSLSVEDVEAGYNLDVVLNDVRATGPGGATVRIGSLATSWEWESIFDANRVPRSVRIDGMVAALDVAALKRDPTHAAQGLLQDRGARRVGRSTTLTVTNSKLTLGGIPGLDLIEVDNLDATASPESDDWRGTFRGRCVAGCGEAQKISGALSAADGELRASVELEEAVVIALHLPRGPESVSAKRLRVTMGESADHLLVAAEMLVFPVTVGALQGELSVEAAEVRLDSSGGPLAADGITLVRPHLSLTDSPASAGARAAGGTSARVRGEREAALIKAERDLRHLLPVLQKLSVADGRLSIAPWGIELTGLKLGSEREVVLVEGDLWASHFGARLQHVAPQIEVRGQDLDLAALIPYVAPALASVVSGRVSGRLALGSTPTLEEVQIEAELNVVDGQLKHAAIAPTPVEVERATLVVNAAYTPRAGRGPDLLEVERMTVTLPSASGGDDVRVHLAGSASGLLDPAAAAKVQVSVWLDETECATAVAAIPAAMMPNIRGHLQLEGRFAPRVDFSVDMADTDTTRFEVSGLPGTCAISSLGEFDPEYLNEDFEMEVREGVSEPGLVTVGPLSGHYTRLGEIPVPVSAAMYLTEEASFYRNRGFGVGLIRRALKINLDRGRYVYGGSSVSQQLVKNLFLSREKTLARKLEEAFIVWRLEDVVPKDRILELYVNCIEFGPDLYGITSASQRYFGKAPAALTPMEGAYLAGLKPAPWNGAAFKAKGRTPAAGWWHKRLRTIMERLYEYGHISAKELREAEPYVLFFPGNSWEDFPELA